MLTIVVLGQSLNIVCVMITKTGFKGVFFVLSTDHGHGGRVYRWKEDFRIRLDPRLASGTGVLIHYKGP